MVAATGRRCYRCPTFWHLWHVSNEFYICEDYYLLVYETKDNAITTAYGSFGSVGWARFFSSATYWSKNLNSRVTFANPSEPIFVIKKEDKFWNVIIGERIGWIIAEEWMLKRQTFGETIV